MRWKKEQTEYLIKFWPHFGSYGMKKIMPELSMQQIKSKVNKLKLVLLKKQDRLCFCCKSNNQSKRTYGILCRLCFLSKRKDTRGSVDYSFDLWMKEMARTCRYRSQKRGEISDVTDKFLEQLWLDQKGLCAYSQFSLELPKHKMKRNPLSASIDRINSNKGYTKNNIVWCCWACNCGKSDFSIADYLNICEAVIKNKNKMHDYSSKSI